MPTDITLRGMLEPIRIEENFMETANVLENMAARGKEFVVATDDGDGNNIAVAIRNILAFKEVD